MRRERGRWYGPARVAVIERNRVIWLTHGHRLIRASPEQLRPASLREWRAVQEAEGRPVAVERALEGSRHADFVSLEADDVPEAADLQEQGDAPMEEPLADLPESEREESSGAMGQPIDLDPADVPVPEDTLSHSCLETIWTTGHQT